MIPGPLSGRPDTPLEGLVSLRQCRCPVSDPSRFGLSENRIPHTHPHGARLRDKEPKR